MELLLDTSFVIDLERELLKGTEGPAAQFLMQHGNAGISISFVTVGELAVGFSVDQRSRLQNLIRPYQVISYTEDIGWSHGMIYRHLAGLGMLIGADDTWIAACAITENLTIVTRNEKHFRRVPHLEVLSY